MERGMKHRQAVGTPPPQRRKKRGARLAVAYALRCLIGLLALTLVVLFVCGILYVKEHLVPPADNGSTETLDTSEDTTNEEVESTSLPLPPTDKYTVVLDAGHGGVQSGSNSTEPPSNSTGGTQQNDEPTTPPPSESDKTPDTTEPQDTETTEPQGTETTEPSKSGGLTDKTPLYLGGDIAVTREDFDIPDPNNPKSDYGLIEFDDAGTVGEVTLNFTVEYYGDLQVNHDVTLSSDTATVMDFYETLWEQIKAADAKEEHFSTYTLDMFIECYQNGSPGFSWNMTLADGELSGEDLLNSPISEVDYIMSPLGGVASYRVNDGAEISAESLSFQVEHDISVLVEGLGVPKYALVCAGDHALVDMYLWDAGDHWLALECVGCFVYFSKSISADMIQTPGLYRIRDCLDEIAQ